MSSISSNPVAISCMQAVAQHPFNEPECADIIIKSSDNVHFYMNKTILSFSSPVFKVMFSLPPLPLKQEGEEIEKDRERPIIPVQDNSQELFQLLLWCDPRGKFSTDVQDMLVALRLADKYEMEVVIQRISVFLEVDRQVIKDNCFRVYALAVRCQLPKLAEMSAKYCVEIPALDTPDVEEFRLISGVELQSLYKYRNEHIRSVQQVMGNHEWAKALKGAGDPTWPELRLMNANDFSCSCARIELHKDVQTRAWLLHYMNILATRTRELPTTDGLLDEESFKFILKNCCTTCRKAWEEWRLRDRFVKSIARKVEEAKATVGIF